jgi:Ca2+/Na+ antiporter
MLIQDFEKVRNKYSKLYMSFFLIAGILMLLSIVFLIILDFNLKWWLFAILAALAIFLILLFIYLADQTEKRYIKKYNQSFQETIIKPIITSIFKDVEWGKTQILDLSEVPLIGKSHKYKILNEIHTPDYSIFEISMLNDLRFRGYVIKKELKVSHQPFIMTNYNYYFKPKINDPKVVTGIEAFDNRYLLYSKNSNYKMDQELAQSLYGKLVNFEQVGILVENNITYYVLAFRSNLRRELNLNIPLIDPINEDYLKKIREFIHKLKSIGEFEL